MKQIIAKSNDGLGIYDKKGAILMECANGVVVEWDGYSKADGYGDEYKTLILYKQGTDKREFVTDDPFVTAYCWA